MSDNKTIQEIEQLLKDHTAENKPLNFRAACRYLDFRPSHLYKLTHRKAIPYYKPNGKKIYFNKADLDQYLLRNRVKSADEIDAEASNYIVNGKSKKDAA